MILQVRDPRIRLSGVVHLKLLIFVASTLHDIAGATLMAAGASSPELFSSIVALFVTHSALGLGTVCGGELWLPVGLRWIQLTGF